MNAGLRHAVLGRACDGRSLLPLVRNGQAGGAITGHAASPEGLKVRA